MERELSKWLYIIIVFFINPIVGLISILINIQSIILLTNKNLKKETKRLYIYFNVHLLSNIIFIFCHNIDLIFECTYEDYFCSTLKNSVYADYFKIILLKLIKNSLVTFSNISYSSFILTRFIKIIGRDDFKKFNNFPLKFYLLITILGSILINIYVCFEYSISLKMFLYIIFHQKFLLIILKWICLIMKKFY